MNAKKVSYEIMLVVSNLQITNEQTVFGLEHGHVELIDPAPLKYFTGISYLGPDKTVEIWSSLLKG